jgi:hypothetical protein
MKVTLTGAVAGQQRVNPGPGDPVSAGDLADRAILDSDSRDNQAGFRHALTGKPNGRIGTCALG